MLATILLGWCTLIGRRRGWFGDVAVAMLGLAALAVMAVVTGGFAPSLATTYLPLAIVIVAGPLGLAAGATAARVLSPSGRACCSPSIRPPNSRTP